jgi:acetyl esterase/lipase/hemerythrin-like domain-containing protein
MAAYGGIQEAIADSPREFDDDYDGVMDILYQEHGYILSLLDMLEEAAARLEPRRVPDFLLLRDIVDYLLHYPDQYHHPREDLVFAGLRRNNPDFHSSYDRLQREHGALHDRNSSLFEQLSYVCEGRPADRKSLLRAIMDYVEAYRAHIEFESQEIFPLARIRLTKSQLRKIEEKTRFQNDPLFGAGVRRQYHRLKRLVRLRVASAEQDVLFRQFEFLESLLENLTETTTALRTQPMLERLPRLPRFCGGPSWQAKLMNTVSRTLMKPMLRYGNVDSIRSVAARIDAQQERDTDPDVRWTRVRARDYDGEWVKIVRRRPSKVLLYLPGGGFIMRMGVQHRNSVARICRAANCKALLVNYRLAPETPFPGGLEDCLAAYHDLLQQGVAPEDIILAGDSAGGGLVLSTLLALRDESTPMPSCAIVLSPLGDLTYSGESRRLNSRRDPVLPARRASGMHQLYIGDATPKDRYLSPVLADFDGLPPILGQVGSTEILLDDTVRAARRAKEAGIPFYLEIWREMPHVFPFMKALPESDAAIERIARFIQEGSLEPLPARYGRSEPRR